jgi:Zn-dependent protease with chaperone function
MNMARERGPVPDEYDESARAVFSRAVEQAWALGHDGVGTEHLLLGFCQEDERGNEPILAPAGITTDVVRAWVREHGGQAGGAPDARPLPFTWAARSVLKAARQEADGRRHESIGAHHLLLGLIRYAVTPAPGPDAGPHRQDALAALIRDLDIDTTSLYLRVIARANSAASDQGFPYLGADLAAHTRLPGTRERWLRHGAVIIGYACLAAPVVVWTPPGTQAVAVVVAAVAPTGLFAVRRILLSLSYRLYDSVPEYFERIETPALRIALASSGIRDVAVYSAAERPFLWGLGGLALRSGRRGWIILRGYLNDPAQTDPDLARFIAAHEVAHIARDDSMTGDLASVGRFCIAVIVLLTRPDAWWLLIPLAAVVPLISWRAELACDRMAAQITGPIAARQEIASFRRADQESRRRRPLRRLGSRLWGLRTHPTPRMRYEAIERMLAKDLTTPMLERGLCPLVA